MDHDARPHRTEVLLADRQQGKTAHALAWLVDGHPIDSYPRWSRALVCVNDREAADLGTRLPWARWRKCIVAFSELRSFSLAVTPGTVELAFDNVHVVLWELLYRQTHGRARTSLLTFDGTAHVQPDLEAVEHAVSMLDDSHRCEPGTCRWSTPEILGR